MKNFRQLIRFTSIIAFTIPLTFAQEIVRYENLKNRKLCIDSNSSAGEFAPDESQPPFINLLDRLPRSLFGYLQAWGIPIENPTLCGSDSINDKGQISLLIKVSPGPIHAWVIDLSVEEWFGHFGPDRNYVTVWQSNFFGTTAATGSDLISFLDKQVYLLTNTLVDDWKKANPK